MHCLLTVQRHGENRKKKILLLKTSDGTAGFFQSCYQGNLMKNAVLKKQRALEGTNRLKIKKLQSMFHVWGGRCYSVSTKSVGLISIAI